MKIVFLFTLTLFGYSLQMKTSDPPLEQMTDDQVIDTSKLMGVMHTFKDEVNPSLKSTNGMVLDTLEFHAIITPELKQLAAVFKKYDFEIRIVGGAVRDLLEGKKPHDLDFATVATRTEMKQMFEKEGIRIVNEEIGVHNTITVHINKLNFEITTLRGFVLTDDGHVEQVFTKDWKIDAAHRDFTINSIYLDFQGTLYDYFNGYEDLKARNVVFIGNPDTNIKGSYIRILRYFRFYGRFAVNPRRHDEKILKAIRENGTGLANVPGQNIWAEFKKILNGNFICEIIEKIFALGLGQHIGLNHMDKLDVCCFNKVCPNAAKLSCEPITMIAALLKTVDDVLTFHNRIKLSKFELDTALYIVNHKNDELPATIEERLRHFQKSVMSSKNRVHCRAFIIELLKVLDEEKVYNVFESWTIPKFPITSDFLYKKGIKGRDKVELFNKLRQEWTANNFTLDDKVLTELISQFKAGKMTLKTL